MLVNLVSIVALVPVCATVVSGKKEDLFNFGRTRHNNFGPEDWGMVQCNDHATCPGWPDDWETYKPFIPYKETKNKCKDCSRGSERCTGHRQSPLNLYRNITGERRCGDRHLMYQKGGSEDCGLDNMRFTLERHALRAYQPMDEDTNTTCSEPFSIDFSWGFPSRWLLVHTDIGVPSSHMLNGKRFDAEVVLAHRYAKKKDKRYIGKVSIMLEKGTKADRYDFLDKYIYRWRHQTDLIRADCKSKRNLLRKLNDDDDDEESIADEKELVSLLDDHDAERKLAKRPFTPYDWLQKLDTEYYFRYMGSQFVPPCMEAVHWRVMRTPIKVSPKQIRILQLMIKTRRNPVTCRRDTAGIKRKGTVFVNRPIQTRTTAHKVVFCECNDWDSEKAGDHEYCRMTPKKRGILPYAEPEKGRK